MMSAPGPDILDDLLRDDLLVVFCGTRAGTASARRGAYYAGPGNRFWATLHQAGLTQRRLRPEQFRDLLAFRIGLTDLAKTTAGQDADMMADDLDIQRFRASIRRHAPKIVAFTSKTAAAAALRLRGTGRLAYGRVDERIEGAEVYVLPSTSGLATSYWDIKPWKALGLYVQHLREGDARMTEQDCHATA